MALLFVLLFQSVCIGFWVFLYLIFQYKVIIIIDVNILEVLKCRIRKKSMKPYIKGLQDGCVCHMIMYQKKEDVIETDDIVKKFLASVLRLHI